MVFYNNVIAGAAGAGTDSYEISKSLRFNSGDSSFLSRTPSSASNRKTWTWSGWVKRSALGATQGRIFGGGTSDYFDLYFPSGDELRVLWTGNNLTTTTAVFRDPSAWYHIVLAVDTTQSTASDRIKIYVNGTLQDRSSTNPSQNYDTAVNNTVEHHLGKYAGGTSSSYLDGYLAEVHFVDGQALAPTDFGEYDSNNVWVAKKFTGSHGNNGFNLDFSDTSDLGNDAAGSNNWTVNNLVGVAPGLSTANQGFDVVTYTGTGSDQAISGLNFQPDFVWIKTRNEAENHFIVDSVRGVTKQLYANLNSQEYTNANRFKSFNSNGFTVGTTDDTNQNNNTFVAWCWKAGGTASSNSNGTITSSVSANNTYGFSVCSYTGNGTAGATVGHGLSSAPKWIVVKSRSRADNWRVYHSGIGATKSLFLSTNGTADTNTGYWNDTAPTSSVFSLGTDTGVNTNSDPVIAYCWSEVSGFSKFGTYSGTAASGNKVTTGFKPKFVLIKRVGNGSDGDTNYGGWGMYQEGQTDKQLMANCTGEEGVRGNCDTGSNTRDIQADVVFNNDGFTLSSAWYEQNDNGVTYIYAAFAGKPDDSIVDSFIDVPMNLQASSGNNPGNYATLNPLDRQSTNGVLSNGNLELTQTSAAWAMYRSTIFVSSGKYYWECTLGNNQYSTIGICTDEYSMVTGGWVNQTSDMFGYYPYDGKKYNGSSSASYATADTSASGSVIGVALDMDNGTLTFYKNGVSLGTAYTALTGKNVSPTHWLYNQTNADLYNFGQRPFAYTPPTGYKSLCTTNLADPTIADGSTAFNAKTYTGTDNSNAITGLGHSPDLLWIKRRSGASGGVIFDQIRGVGTALEPANSGADKNNDPPITSFDTDGFTVGGSYSQVNANNETYIAWSWDAGSSNASISAGSLNSSLYDQSQTWSSGITTGSSPNSSYGVANAFNGVKTGLSNTCFVNNSSHVQVDFTNLSSASTVTVHYTANGSGVLKVNGTNQTIDGSGSNVYRSVTVNVSGLSSVRWEQADGSNFVGVSGIEVDGKLLVDNGVTLANVPSIASTYRANPSSGVSIVTWTGQSSGSATIGHGLNAAPEFIILKGRTGSVGWTVGHESIGWTKRLKLNSTDAVATSSNYWNDTAPTSSVFTSGSNNTSNTFVAYCFSPVSGFSSFGSYIGNGNADGPFVYTGHRSRFLLIKADVAGEDWVVLDTARETSNVQDAVYFPNSSSAEVSNSAYNTDILSNGFKLRGTNPRFNQNNATYLYASFAEHPFKAARAR